jgi:hypothetical protein
VSSGPIERYPRVDTFRVACYWFLKQLYLQFHFANGDPNEDVYDTFANAQISAYFHFGLFIYSCLLRILPTLDLGI